MKINIWIKIDDAISGNITSYELQQPYTHKGKCAWVQVSITRDEFATIKDNNLHKSKSVCDEYLNVKGGDFPKYWDSISSEDKRILINEYFTD